MNFKKLIPSLFYTEKNLLQKLTKSKFIKLNISGTYLFTKISFYVFNLKINFLFLKRKIFNSHRE
jgi:hypothetical protein